MGETATSQAVVTCAEPDCSEPGKWRPVIHVFGEKGKIPGEAILKSMLICDSHKDEAAKDIMESDDCWAEISKHFTGYGKLVRERTKILYELVV